MDLSNKRALVTGASSGIGRSLVGELARSSCSLVLAARRVDVLGQVADEIERETGHRPHVIAADLARRRGAATLAEQVHDTVGPIDVLVNNAGGSIGGYQPTVGDRDEARELFELNVWTPAALVAAFVPAMRERREGYVVNVTSVLRSLPWPTLGSYSASKAALAALTDTLRLELTGSGVRVLEVVPGPVATPMQGESLLVPGMARLPGSLRPGSPDRLARLVVNALARDRERVVYPRQLRIIAGRPGLLRLFAGYAAGRVRAEFDLDDTRVLRAGSHDDPVSRRARDAWLRGIRDPQMLRALSNTAVSAVPQQPPTPAQPPADETKPRAAG